MKVFVNERSFDGTASTEKEALQVLEEMVRVASHLKKQANNANVLRHRELKNRLLLDNVSIVEFIIQLSKDRDPKHKKMARTFLEVFAKGPFAVERHGVKDSIQDEVNTCLKKTCFDDASEALFGAAVISASISRQYASPMIKVNSSLFGLKQVANFYNEAAAEKETWVYEPNPKHSIPKDKVVNGDVYSAMRLSDEEAQAVLTNGLMVGGVVFNRVGEQWYKFHCHHENRYHGFPIQVKTPYKEYSFSRKFFDERGENNSGQIDGRLFGDT